MSDLSDTAKEQYLRAHLEQHYGVHVESLQRLDRSVFIATLHDGRRWIARVFPARRSLEQVEGDAAVLRYLERHGFPAERCADATPVTVLHDRGVLITEYIEGTSADDREAISRTVGAMLARLNSMPAAEGAVAREAGALHHYVLNCGGPEHELSAANSWLAAIVDQLPDQGRAPYDALCERVLKADTCDNLPQALIHPDPVPKNLLATSDNNLVWIDWTGAGRGPRIAALANLIWSCALQRGGWSPQRVDAVVAGYRAQIQLEASELERLGAVMAIRPLVFACWRYRHAVNSGQVPDGSEWWWPDDELTQTVAARGCAAFRR